jgi:hypothetical protein
MRSEGRWLPGEGKAMVVETREVETESTLPPGVVDRWLLLDEAALVAGRARAQLHMALGRGRLRGRKVSRRWHNAWEIRLSDLHRYVSGMGRGPRGGPRPQKPTTLDWDLLARLPMRSEEEQPA